MNMDEFLKKIEAQDTALAKKLREIALDELIKDAEKKGLHDRAAMLRAGGPGGLESPDLIRMEVAIKGTVRKYHGEYHPDKEPFEVIEVSG
jgi:hypothetical protein